MPQKIEFVSDHFKLEGLLHRMEGEKAVVITHPHPLYGGDMYNPVVDCAARAYQRMGITTLRFNFRGAGLSEGTYDNGIGEQADVSAALRYLQQDGCTRIALAGYSFGAWVDALAVPQNDWIEHLVLISPPVAFLDFKAVGRIAPLKLVVTGVDDEIAPPDRIEQMLPKWNDAAAFEIVAGADHFYGGREAELTEVLTRHIG